MHNYAARTHQTEKSFSLFVVAASRQATIFRNHRRDGWNEEEQKERQTYDSHYDALLQQKKINFLHRAGVNKMRFHFSSNAFIMTSAMVQEAGGDGTSFDGAADWKWRRRNVPSFCFCASRKFTWKFGWVCETFEIQSNRFWVIFSEEPQESSGNWSLWKLFRSGEVSERICVHVELLELICSMRSNLVSSWIPEKDEQLVLETRILDDTIDASSLDAKVKC